MPRVFNQLGSRIKEKLSHVDAITMRENIKDVYVVLNLMDTKGNWLSPKLEAIGNQLYDETLTMKEIYGFIDEVIDVNYRNRYLKKNLPKVGQYNYEHLFRKFYEEGEAVIPKAVAYAYVLEKLTKACADNWHVLESIYEIFTTASKEKGLFQALPLFHKIKLISVNIPMKNTYLAAHRKKSMAPKSGAIAVAINILEATITEFKSGNRGNAFCGWVLASNKCGKLHQDDITGAGPSGLSEDGKMIERRYPLPERWAALYQVWNMGFCLRFRDFPFVISKLLIPQVAGFQEKPYEYINNRAIALYIYLNYAGFDYIRKKERKEAIIDWHDRRLMIYWGKLNKVAAKKYEKKLDKVKNVESDVFTMKHA